MATAPDLLVILLLNQGCDLSGLLPEFPCYVYVGIELAGLTWTYIMLIYVRSFVMFIVPMAGFDRPGGTLRG